jgi:hypothetical protein
MLIDSSERVMSIAGRAPIPTGRELFGDQYDKHLS